MDSVVERAAFNTSKVRLGGDSHVSVALPNVNFQYLEGAIRRDPAPSDPHHLDSFQYLEGAIRRLGLVAGPHLQHVAFQYLEGAIRSDTTLDVADETVNFQYLEGAIRSCS